MISGQILDGKNIKQAANLLQQGDVSIPKYVNVKDCALVFYRFVTITTTMFVYLRRTATEYLNAGYIIIISEPTIVYDGFSTKVSSVNITNFVGSAIYIYWMKALLLPKKSYQQIPAMVIQSMMERY